MTLVSGTTSFYVMRFLLAWQEPPSFHGRGRARQARQDQGEFQANYRAMLDGVLATKLPAAVCTIYEANYKNPDTHRVAATGLAVFTT